MPSNEDKLGTVREWRNHFFGFPVERWGSIADRTYWITGAGTGYGQAMAVALAAAGAQVIITGRRKDKLSATMRVMQELGISTDKCHPISADITDFSQLTSACLQVENLCPSLDGLINNAALPNLSESTSPLQNETPEHWNRILATNVTAPWMLSRSIFGHLLKSGIARILFIGSGAGWADTPGMGPYNVSKAALNSLSQSMAQEYSRDFPDKNIQINTLVPGEAKTEMNQDSTASPYAIVRMALLLLTQEISGPNGRFFTMEGDHLSFGVTKPYEKPLFEVQKEFSGIATSRMEVQQKKQFCLHKVLSYDDSSEDIRYLDSFANYFPGLHRHFSTSNNGKLAIYGAGRLTRYILGRHQELVSYISFIIEDNPEKRKEKIHGISVIALENLPETVEAVFISSTKTLSLTRMLKLLVEEHPKINCFDLSVIKELQLSAVPARAWRKYEQSIYPIEIPEVKFEKGKDMLLLEMPPRYFPFMPYGLGCVHNILETTGIDFQTMDLNIIWYHRYHMARIMDGVENPDWVVGDQTDPWSSTLAQTWEKSDNDSFAEINHTDSGYSSNNNYPVINYFRKQIQEVIDAIVEAKPRMLGFSLNLNNTLMVHEVIKGVKKHLPETVILVGGYAFYSHQLALARNSSLYDYVIVGEGEYSIPPLIKKLKEGFETGEMPKNMPGILSKFDSPKRIWSALPNVSDLSNQVFPKYPWIEYATYSSFEGHLRVPTCTSRGCSWSRCKFCSECANYYNRTPKHFVDELEWHVKKGCADFHLFESDINGDHENLQEIMNEIVRRDLNISLYGQFRIDRRNTPEFFRSLKAAGFHSLRFGVDGWTDNTLKKQVKSCNMKIVEQNLKDATEAGLLCNVNMVLGVPGETDEDVEESYKNIVRLKPYINMFETLGMLRVSAGSAYYEDPDKFKIRFRGNRDAIYREHKVFLPENLWYSEDPYIDDEVRVQRFRKIVRGCHEGGVVISHYIKWEVVQEVNRIEGTNETDFEKVIYAEPTKRTNSNNMNLSTNNNFGLQGDELEASAMFENSSVENNNSSLEKTDKIKQENSTAALSINE